MPWVILTVILLSSVLLVVLLLSALTALNAPARSPTPFALVPAAPLATNPLASATLVAFASTATVAPQVPITEPTTLPTVISPTNAPEIPPTPLPTMPNGMLFADDFASLEVVRQNGWTLADDEKWNRTWAPYQYILTSKTKGIVALDYPQPEFDDAGIQIEGQLASGDYAAYGIVLRAIETNSAYNCYLFGVTTDGSFFLAQLVNNVWMEPLLVPFTESAAIKTGNTRNRLSALVEGNTIRLYINGTLVRVVTDASISGKGHAGVFVYSGNHDRAQAAFNRIAVLTASKAQSVWAPLSTLATAQPAPTEIAALPTPLPPTATSLPPTATRRPPAVQPSPTYSLYGNLRFADGFAGNYAGWDEGTDALAQHYFQDGQYHIVVTAPDTDALGNPGQPLPLSDFVLETRVTALEGPLENAAGLIFRQQNSGTYYIFRVSPNGGFALARYRDRRYERITNEEWIYTSAIHGGYATNLLRVHARGDRFTLYINDVQVGAFSDGAYSNGRVGIAASVWGNAGSHFTFDDFRVWDNSANQTAPTPQAQPPDTITVFFTIQSGSPSGYVIDKQGVRHNGSAQATISGIPLAAGDRIVLQTDAPRFSFMFDCSTEPQAFSPCDLTADTPENLPGEIRANKNGALGFLNISRADNWGNPRPGHEPQRYPADPVLRIVLGD